MARTLLRQDAQINSSINYITTPSPQGATLQTSAASIEDDLNGLRSQEAWILDATGATPWTNAIPTVNGKKRGLLQLNTSLNTVETMPFTQPVQNSANVPVPAGQNYVVLSVSGNQAPNLPAAIATTTLGAVVAQSTLNGSAFAANELTSIAGTNAITPMNLCLVRLASSGQEIESGGEDIYALLQVESTGADGGTFNDTSAGTRVKLSFVTQNVSARTLQAAAAADIGGKTIQFIYMQRLPFASLPQQAFNGGINFVDNIASVDVRLDTAVVNQNGAAVPVNVNIPWQLGASNVVSYANSAGSQTFWSLTGGGAMTYNLASLAVQSATAPTFNTGVTVGTSGTPINVDITAGQIDSAGLKLASTGANPLALSAGAAVTFADGFLAGSTYGSAAMKLAASSAEYTTFTTDFGAGTSLIGALTQLYTAETHSQQWATVTAATIAPGTTVTGAGSSPNISAQLPAYGSAASFVGQCMVVLNGDIMCPGLNSSANCDVYPAGTAANGEFAFKYLTLTGAAGHADNLALICFKQGFNS